MIPNDEYLPMQWHLHNTGQFGYTPDADINALEAWEITTGDPNIVIAIVDEGVDANHPDLLNNLVPGYDFLDDDESTHPERDNFENVNGHGTMCAGLAAAQGNNCIGVTGVTWNCKIMPIRVSRTRDGANDVYDWITNAQTAKAFRWAAANGAVILSNSWGNHSQGSLNQVLHSAIIDITRTDGIGRDGNGCLVLFASGNQGGYVNQAARVTEAIGVGATGENDSRRDYSNFGPELDVTAPSGSLTSPWTQGTMSTDISGDEGVNKTDYRSGCGGTSTSTPIVAGLVALMLSVEPNLTSHEVRHFLMRSALDLGEPGKDDYYGWGRVDARAALDMILAKRADLNDDWKVDEEDLALLDGLLGTNSPLGDIAPAARRDGVVDEQDIELLMRYLDVDIPKMPDPNLAAHWALDESEGTVAHDSYDIYGDALHPGEVHGDALWQPDGGIRGGALQLDGAESYISTPFVLNPGDSPLSVFAWVKGGAAGQVIASQEDGANWLMADAEQGTLRTDLTDPVRTGRKGTTGGLPLISATAITDGDWHCVGLSWDGSNRVLYVDDVEVARDTLAELRPSQSGLNLGAGSKREQGSFFSGLIDDVRIYNHAVTP